MEARQLVTVAEVTTTIRGLAAEIEFDHVAAGLDRYSVINCDGLHPITQASLTSRVGDVDDGTMADVCWAATYALGC